MQSTVRRCAAAASHPVACGSLMARGAVRAMFVVPLTEQKWPNGGCCQRMWNKTSNLSGSCFFLPDVFTASRSPPVVLNFQAGLEWTATICESVTSSSPAPDDPDGPMPDVFSHTLGGMAYIMRVGCTCRQPSFVDPFSPGSWGTLE